jgi:small GTP-binding protein
LNDKKYIVKIWDTAGQERYRSLTRNFFKNADGIIVVYDITDRKTFDMVQSWIQSVDENSKIKKQMILIGNKCDLEESREVSTGDGRNLANYYEMSFFETSAKDNVNLDQAFNCIINKVIESMQPPEEEDTWKLVPSNFTSFNCLCN